MEIKVNDYVRTKKGIKKIYKIDSNKTKWKYLFKLKEQDGDGCIDLGYLCAEDIIGEPKEKIIDLIEVGDYVNKHRVSNVFDEYITTEDDQITIDKKNIKSIVTKEQFEQMEYKVGE